MNHEELDAFETTQRRFAAVVRREDEPPLAGLDGLLVAGADVAFDDDEDARAVVTVMRLPDLEVVDEVVLVLPIAAPYLPGAFAARELPPLVEALEGLKAKPDVVLCDGHGIAHPRRCGLASHMGVLLDLRTIGCAKTILVGEHGALAPERGSTAELIDEGEVVGAAVRTSDGVNPVYVSVGHRVSLETAVKVVLACSRFRIPEPLRRADHLSRGS